MTNEAIFGRLLALDHGLYLSWLVGFGLFAALLAWLLYVAFRVRVWCASPPRPRLLAGCAALLAIDFVWLAGLVELERAVVLERYEAFFASGVVGVRVDGAVVSDPRSLETALTHLFDGHPDHSLPTAAHEVIVETRRGPLVLTLRPDSKDSSNLWVYDHALALTRENAIGHARTDYFTH